MTSPIGPLTPSVITPLTQPASAPSSTDGGKGFADALASGLQYVQGAQNKADDMAVKAATGNLTDVHDYMIASTEASLATQLTVAVRNKAVEAFNEIMRMQA